MSQQRMVGAEARQQLLAGSFDFTIAESALSDMRKCLRQYSKREEHLKKKLLDHHQVFYKKREKIIFESDIKERAIDPPDRKPELDQKGKKLEQQLAGEFSSEDEPSFQHEIVQAFNEKTSARDKGAVTAATYKVKESQDTSVKLFKKQMRELKALEVKVDERGNRCSQRARETSESFVDFFQDLKQQGNPKKTALSKRKSEQVPEYETYPYKLRKQDDPNPEPESGGGLKRQNLNYNIKFVLQEMSKTAIQKKESEKKQKEDDTQGTGKASKISTDPSEAIDFTQMFKKVVQDKKRISRILQAAPGNDESGSFILNDRRGSRARKAVIPQQNQMGVSRVQDLNPTQPSQASYNTTLRTDESLSPKKGEEKKKQPIMTTPSMSLGTEASPLRMPPSKRQVKKAVRFAEEPTVDNLDPSTIIPLSKQQTSVLTKKLIHMRKMRSQSTVKVTSGAQREQLMALSAISKQIQDNNPFKKKSKEATPIERRDTALPFFSLHPTTPDQEQKQQNQKDIMHFLKGNVLKIYLQQKSRHFSFQALESMSEQEWINLILTTNLDYCPYHIFERKIKKREIMNGVIIGLMQKMEEDGIDTSNFTRNKLEYAIQQGDKDLFIKFRDRVITYDQLMARGAEKRGYAKYVVLDDYRTKLNKNILKDEQFMKDYLLRYGNERSGTSNSPLNSMRNSDAKKKKKQSLSMKDLADLPNPPVDDILRPQEDWEIDHKCIRSIRYKHKKDSTYAEESRKLKQLNWEKKQIQKAENEAKEKEDLKKQLKEEQQALIKSLKEAKKKKPATKEDHKSQYQRRFSKLVTNYLKQFELHQRMVKQQSAFYSRKEQDALSRLLARAEAHADAVPPFMNRSQSTQIESREEELVPGGWREKAKQNVDKALAQDLRSKKPKDSKKKKNDQASDDEIENLIDLPYVQFGRKSEFRLIQKKENDSVDKIEHQNWKSMPSLKKGTKVFNTTKDDEESPMNFINTQGMNLVQVSQYMKKIKAYQQKVSDSKLMFLKQIQEDGKNIIISPALKEKLHVIDFIGDAMEADFKDCEKESPVLQRSNSLPGNLEEALNRNPRLNRFYDRIQRQLSVQIQEKEQELMAEIERKKEAIEAQQSPRVIGLVNKCPILMSLHQSKEPGSVKSIRSFIAPQGLDMNLKGARQERPRMSSQGSQNLHQKSINIQEIDSSEPLITGEAIDMPPRNEIESIKSQGTHDELVNISAQTSMADPSLQESPLKMQKEKLKKHLIQSTLSNERNIKHFNNGQSTEPLIVKKKSPRSKISNSTLTLTNFMKSGTYDSQPQPEKVNAAQIPEKPVSSFKTGGPATSALNSGRRDDPQHMNPSLKLSIHNSQLSSQPQQYVSISKLFERKASHAKKKSEVPKRVKNVMVQSNISNSSPASHFANEDNKTLYDIEFLKRGEEPVQPNNTQNKLFNFANDLLKSQTAQAAVTNQMSTLQARDRGQMFSLHHQSIASSKHIKNPYHEKSPLITQSSDLGQPETAGVPPTHKNHSTIGDIIKPSTSQMSSASRKMILMNNRQQNNSSHSLLQDYESSKADPDFVISNYKDLQNQERKSRIQTNEQVVTLHQNQGPTGKKLVSNQTQSDYQVTTSTQKQAEEENLIDHSKIAITMRHKLRASNFSNQDLKDGGIYIKKTVINLLKEKDLTSKPIHGHPKLNRGLSQNLDKEQPYLQRQASQVHQGKFSQVYERAKVRSSQLKQRFDQARNYQHVRGSSSPQMQKKMKPLDKKNKGRRYNNQISSISSAVDLRPGSTNMSSSKEAPYYQHVKSSSALVSVRQSYQQLSSYGGDDEIPAWQGGSGVYDSTSKKELPQFDRKRSSDQNWNVLQAEGTLDPTISRSNSTLVALHPSASMPYFR